ncbi:MAG TPA: hypothetical protein VEH05_06655 [Streptosporangiaceae bacterium]|nr:hypothetical protein [Streptosporangiaceae bacterium]
MNTLLHTPGRRAGVAAAAVAAAALALAACGGSSSGSGSAATGSTSKPASSHTSSPAGSTSAAAANSVPFPIGVGDTWTYSTSDVAGTTGTVVNKMVAVSPVAGGQQVTMDSTNTILGTTTTNTAYYIFHSDGSITLPFSQFNTSSSSSDVKLLSGTLEWPSASALASGATSSSTIQIQFSTNGQTENVTADIAVKGVGTQSVTVPAGSYTATVVDMTMSETVEGIPVSDTVTTWLAPGVGPVKSEVTLDENGTSTVAGTQVLTSFTQG